jgi:phage terminase large subunit GpA-like protein
MRVYFAYSGSKTGTKSRPIRYLLCEEPDEFVDFSSKGGDPLSKAEKRLTTYRDKGLSRILLGGTPTTRKGVSWKRWELCAVRYHFWVPCPHCGVYQLLTWNQVKYERAAAGESIAQHSERIKSTGAAWYECSSDKCKQKIHDHHKPGMLRAGKWATEDQVVTPDGRIVGPERSAKRVGVKISCLYSPWVTFAILASEWIEAQGDVESLADFINQRLAEPFEQQVEAPKEDEFTAKRDRAIHENIKPGIIPTWSGALYLTVDVQMEGMWCLVVAWGYRYRSRLIWYGFVRSWDEVYDLAVHRLWPVENSEQQVRVQLCLIDSGGGTALDHRESRTQEVYRFVERGPGFFIPIKGASADQIRTIRASPTAKDSTGKPVPLYTINTQRLKDELMRLVRVAPGAEGEMQFHCEVENEFLAQMTSEHKVREPDGRLVWKRKGSMPNHLWDDWVYQVAAADPDLGAVGRIPSPEQIELERKTAAERQKQREEQRDNPNRPAWMPPAPKDWMK